MGIYKIQKVLASKPHGFLDSVPMQPSNQQSGALFLQVYRLSAETQAWVLTLSPTVIQMSFKTLRQCHKDSHLYRTFLYTNSVTFVGLLSHPPNPCDFFIATGFYLNKSSATIFFVWYFKLLKMEFNIQ